MLANFVFNETSPAAAGAAASSQAVTGVNANYLPPGVCGPLDDYESIDVIAEITGATGGTLQVSLQVSPDNGLSWYECIKWPTANAGDATKYYKSPLSLATTTAAAVQVGKGLVTALTAGSVVNGAFTDRCRLLMTAGASTSAGAPVVVRLAGQRPRMREHGGR
jgi:hypothetical protein